MLNFGVFDNEDPQYEKTSLPFSSLVFIYQ